MKRLGATRLGLGLNLTCIEPHLKAMLLLAPDARNAETNLLIDGHQSKLDRCFFGAKIVSDGQYGFL